VSARVAFGFGRQEFERMSILEFEIPRVADIKAAANQSTNLIECECFLAINKNGGYAVGNTAKDATGRLRKLGACLVRVIRFVLRLAPISHRRGSLRTSKDVAATPINVRYVRMFGIQVHWSRGPPRK
jgi:hypothetical protein